MRNGQRGSDALPYALQFGETHHDLVRVLTEGLRLDLNWLNLIDRLRRNSGVQQIAQACLSHAYGRTSTTCDVCSVRRLSLWRCNQPGSSLRAQQR